MVQSPPRTPAVSNDCSTIEQNCNRQEPQQLVDVFNVNNKTLQGNDGKFDECTKKLSTKGELLRFRGFIKNMRFTDIALVVSSRKLDKISIKGFFIDH